jgi:subtilase family serine protease
MGALMSGILPVAGNSLLEDAQGAISGAIDTVGDAVTDIVDQVQDSSNTPAPEETQPDPVADAGATIDAEPIPVAPLAPIEIDGYLGGTANGIALLQTTRVDSLTHQGWVDITLDLMLTSLIPEVEVEPSIALNEGGTHACFAASADFQDCLAVEWGTEEQFAAILVPHSAPSEVWPKGKALPWTVNFEIPANAQTASLVFGEHRVNLNLGGDQPVDNSEHVPAEPYRPEALPGAPVGTGGYFLGHHHGITITGVTRTPHEIESTWAVINIALEVMSFGEGDALDLPIVVQAEEGLVCYASGEDSDCIQILWGGVNQFNAILTTSQKPGPVAWPRSKGWPTTISFIVPSNMFGATLLYGTNASHIDLLGEQAEPIPWDYTKHYSPLTGLTLHDAEDQTIDLIAVERDAVTADVRLIFEAINRSEHQDFYPRITYDGSRVSDAGRVFDGLHAVDGWTPTVITSTSEALAPGQQTEVTILLPRVSGAGFAEIPHSDDPPSAMLLRLYGDNNQNAADLSEAKRFQPFYVSFDKREGQDDAQFFFPDLVLDSVTLAPDRPTVGDTVTATAVVTNQGPRNAQAATVHLLVNGTLQSITPLPAIAAGESTSVIAQWVATLAPAELTMTVDPEGAVPESTEANNTRTVSFKGGELPDLVITDVVMLAASPANFNQTQYAVTVTNQGFGDSIGFQVLAGAMGGSFFMTYPPMKAGEVVTLQYPWVDKIGTGNVRLVIDAVNTVREIDKTNNVYIVETADLVGTPSVFVDIAPDGVTRVSFEFTNAGMLDTPAAQVKITVDGGITQTLSTGPMLAGETVSLVSEPVPGEGRHTFSAEIDPLGLLPESDNDNNTVVFTYTIGELPELNTRSMGLTPATFEFGQTLTLEFVVANTGGKRSTATIAHIHDPAASVLVGTAIIPAIEPGEEKTVVFEWTLETALTSVQVTLDPLQVVVEESEENNVTALATSATP